MSLRTDPAHAPDGLDARGGRRAATLSIIVPAKNEAGNVHLKLPLPVAGSNVSDPATFSPTPQSEATKWSASWPASASGCVVGSSAVVEGCSSPVRPPSEPALPSSSVSVRAPESYLG